MKNPINIIRLPLVLTIIPLSKSTFYLKLQDGLLPPSISLGERAVGYIEQEYQTVLAAMMAGDSKNDIKELVSSLVNNREKLRVELTNVIN